MHHKGPAPQLHDGSNLRIGIVHARWNDTIIEPLLAGTKAKLQECGVKDSNIVVQTVPGAWELPIAVQRYVLSCPFYSSLLPSSIHLLQKKNWHPLNVEITPTRPPTTNNRRPWPCKQPLCRLSSAVLVSRQRGFSRGSARQLDGRLDRTACRLLFHGAVRRHHRHWRAHQGRDDAL